MKLLKLPKLQKPTKKQVRKFIIYTLIIVLGNAIASAASAFFIIPNHFVMGGTTGVGIFVKNLIGEDHSFAEWAVNITVYGANIILFVIGSIFLGKKFAAATLAGTLLYPTFLSVFTLANDAYMAANNGNAISSDQPVLAAIFGALLFGFGIGIVVRIGASTGGTDIPPLIFHKYFNIPVSVGMWGLDLSICLLQLVKVGLDTVLYGFFITLLSGFIVDLVSPIGMKRAQVMIISKKYKELREMILNKLNRGVTLLYGKTGFLQDKTYVLMTVVSNRDVVRLKNAVQAIDPAAFLMVNVISEVRGNGFSSDKVALPKSEEKMDLEEVTEDPQN